MQVSDFDYYLPPDLIAQEPLEPRDSSRLLVVDRKTGAIKHETFRGILGHLRAGDCLVFNDTRVLLARLLGQKVGEREPGGPPAGARVEFLLLRDLGQSHWEVLVRPGKRLKKGARVSFGEGELLATVLEVGTEGTRVVRFDFQGDFQSHLERLGRVPLPPYITRELKEGERYQTVYAQEEGSAAAPTAGLHFTPLLLEEIRGRNVQTVFITLHVGLGTFRPVKVEKVEEHRMHQEFYEVTSEEAAKINRARAAGGRIIGVGTTVARTLESLAGEDGTVQPGRGWTEIFIYPGYRFKTLDALLTNFHLPKSTLLMLVAAFAGTDLVREAYQEAIDRRYRFFSFGDAMLIF
ncbi:MAG: tRNA preQ1(34) S-adenosylmethionine ribosyltransferase-isomerase QueA [Firmicutes bacterium]|nr:tRNA preQ1(34) S-adenosylmethionine ribosyltransferase-isomerase QueA [Bacillota bacterium]